MFRCWCWLGLGRWIECEEEMTAPKRTCPTVLTKENYNACERNGTRFVRPKQFYCSANSLPLWHQRARTKHTIQQLTLIHLKQTFPASSLHINLKVHPSDPLPRFHHNTFINPDSSPIPRILLPAASPSQQETPSTHPRHIKKDGGRRRQNQRVRPPQHLQIPQSRP